MTRRALDQFDEADAEEAATQSPEPREARAVDEASWRSRVTAAVEAGDAFLQDAGHMAQKGLDIAHRGVEVVAVTGLMAAHGGGAELPARALLDKPVQQEAAVRMVYAAGDAVAADVEQRRRARGLHEGKSEAVLPLDELAETEVPVWGG